VTAVPVRRLYLLRHAEAAPSEKNDRARPLTQAGKLEAETVAQWLVSRGIVPALVLHSPARRVVETLAALKSVMPKLKTREIAELYDAPAGAIYELIKAADDKADSLMIVGHNPGIQTLCGMLAGEAEPSVLEASRRGFSPATLAAFHCPIVSWKDVMPRGNRLTDFFSPGEI
jgi:phosphohistidine phosphatase